MNIFKKILFAFPILLFSCSSDSNEENNTNPDPIGTIYAVGYRYSQTSSKSIATFWKGASVIDLSDGTKDAFATGISVVGTDVYVSGYEATSTTTSVAKYWKNGLATNLSDGTKLAEATAIVVIGNDVYVSGSENNTLGVSVAKYWKNGIPINLTDGIKNANATSITIAGSDIYVAGHEYVTVSSVNAKYWKNGNVTNLSDTTTNCTANAIAINGTTVYVAGILYSPIGINQLFWTNGVENNLPASSVAQINSIVVNQGNVYVGGNDGQKAVYWKNGVSNSLENNASANEYVNAVFVAGNQVYCGGYRDLFGTGDDVATVWYNGTSTVLHSATRSRVKSIYVVN